MKSDCSLLLFLSLRVFVFFLIGSCILRAWYFYYCTISANSFGSVHFGRFSLRLFVHFGSIDFDLIFLRSFFGWNQNIFKESALHSLHLNLNLERKIWIWINYRRFENTFMDRRNESKYSSWYLQNMLIFLGFDGTSWRENIWIFFLLFIHLLK